MVRPNLEVADTCRYPGLFNRIDHVPSYKGILSLEWPAKYGRGGPLTIPNETIRLAEIASYISDSVQEPGIDGLARTSLRFSSQGGP